MLKIIINDQQVDLEGVKFNLQLNSPVPFAPEDGLVEGSFAFGVIFPATSTNKKVFGFPHRLEAYPDAQRDFTGSLYFDGRLLFKIMVTLTESSDYNYKGNIKVDLGYYTSLIGDKSLRDLVYDGEETIGTTTQDVVDHANGVVGQAYPAVKYNFPQLWNERFYGEENKMNPSWQNRVNFYAHGTGFSPNILENENEVRNYYNLCPFPYLFHVLKHCYSEFGYTPTGRVLDDQELAALLIYNNYALDMIVDRYKSVVELSADQAIPEAETQLNFDRVTVNIDECYDNIIFKYLTKESGDYRITGHLSVKAFNNSGNPDLLCLCHVNMYVEDTLVPIIGDNGIGTPYEWEIDLDYVQNIEGADVGKYIYLKIEFIMGPAPLQFYAPGTVFEGSWFGVINATWSTMNIYQKTINLANHVPDIKITAFLVTLMKAFGIVHLFSSKSNDVELLFLRDILASAEEDTYSGMTSKSSKLAGFRETRSYKLNFAWSGSDEYTKENFKNIDSGRLLGSYNTFTDLPSLALEGDMAIVRNLHAAYQFTDSAWTWFTDLHYPLDIGAGKTALNIDCSPLMMYANYDEPMVPKVYPKILQEGSSQNLGRKEFGFHLLFYRGLQPDSNGNTYPFASCNKYGPTGDIIGNYEFILDGDNGLFKTWLEDYYNFVMNRSRPVEYERYFSASEIQAINFIRKKRIFQQLFLIDELSIPISNTSIGVATMKLQKI
jgi:hypothetical protein